MQPLQPMSLPLDGSTIIEASAGTGKTYTIASLYLRYIIEQPLDVAINVDNILVVTFTRAATKELRARIRERLKAAAHYFRVQGDTNDDVIKALYQQHKANQALIIKRLDAAEKSIDEAAIFTIHGFCNRVLKQYGAGHNLQISGELIEDESPLIEAMVEDFWRNALYDFPLAKAKAVESALNGMPGRNAQRPLINQLTGQIMSLLSRKSLNSAPEALPLNPKAAIDKLLSRQDEHWHTARAQMQALLADVARELAAIPRAQAKSVDKHCQALQQWCEKGSYTKAPKASLDYLIKQLDTKAEVAKLGLEQCQQLVAICQNMAEQSLTAPILAQAFQFVKARLNNHKQQRSLMSPDDLMVNLNQALLSQEGSALSKQISTQFPVAMIDEFQDTDPLQFEIFNAIYGNKPHCSWLMIGDPKQAIYGFRGGDIHTYVFARNTVPEEKHYTLATNYRSTQSMVAAANALFTHTSGPFLQGIDYIVVDSQDKGKKGGIYLNDAPLSPLTFRQFEGESTHFGATDCANQIATLLSQSANGQAYLGTPEDNRAIKSGDIAVLVRNRFEANRVSEALSARNIRSVYLSKDSVYGTDLAHDLLAILQAVAQPKDGRALKRALGGALFDFSQSELYQCFNDESLWQIELERMLQYHQLWHQKGVLTLLHTLLFDYQLQHKLRQKSDGERLLADFLHLGELLQGASAGFDGIHALIGYFERQVLLGKESNKEQQRRLESDSELVQIVTIHSSKGLEYPLVFIPYGLGAKQQSLPIFHQDGGNVVDFSGTEKSHLKSEHERLAEDMRLLYVAITRAEYGCFIGLTSIFGLKEGAKSALTLALGAPNEEALAINQAASALAAAQPQWVAVQLADLSQHEGVVEAQNEQSPLMALSCSQQWHQTWRIGSYSYLATHHDAMPTQGAHLDEPNSQSLPPEHEDPDSIPMGPFSFVKGASAGNFLHDTLEQFMLSRAPTQEALTIAIEEQINRYPSLELQQWHEPLLHWLNQVVSQPMVVDSSEPCALAQLRFFDAIPEMEFFLRLDGSLDPNRLNRLLKQYPLFGEVGGDLNFHQFEGMLKGYIDLTFSHQGKYYLLDYKSNHLGMTQADYHTQSMQAAMLSHRYDAQLIIYTLALHRYLKLHLPDYHYDQHIGGGLYLFLRGMDGKAPEHGVIFAKPERALIEALDALFDGKLGEE